MLDSALVKDSLAYLDIIVYSFAMFFDCTSSNQLLTPLLFVWFWLLDFVELYVQFLDPLQIT